MKVSFVSSQAISQALRYQMTRIQADLVKANKEATTWRVADTGLALGARTGVAVSLHREIDRLKGLTDSNQLAASRLASTQLHLQQLSDGTSDLLSAFMTALSSTGEVQVAKAEADAFLATMSSVLNNNLAGEHLFAGINTDVKPFNDFLDPASANRVAFETAFAARFGFGPDDPAAVSITAEAMEEFLAEDIEPQFLGADWNAVWSTATDQQIVSRITLTETAQTSVSANISPIRKLAMAAATVSATLGGDLNQAAVNVVLERAMELLGEAVVELANQQGQTGITQQRIERANERMSMQIDLFSLSLTDLEGVDEIEAATRVTSLEAQLELSYVLTGRMQQLSLLKYL